VHDLPPCAPRTQALVVFLVAKVNTSVQDVIWRPTFSSFSREAVTCTTLSYHRPIFSIPFLLLRLQLTWDAKHRNFSIQVLYNCCKSMSF